MEKPMRSLFDDSRPTSALQRVVGALPCPTSIGPGGSLCIANSPSGQDRLHDIQP